MDIGELRRNAEEAGTATRAFKKELADLEKQQAANRRALEDTGKGMALFGTAVVAGLGLAAKAAIDWESAFTGVRKTVDGSDQQMSELDGQLRQLARTLPTTHEEIAAVAESAGQLGIKRQDIVAFTKTMIDLGNSTNLTADEAATSLAQFMNIMGTASSDVGRLGSSLVALGNDGASTEKDIMEMGLRIAGAGHQIGLTEAQVLSIASALASVGINAEAGGSSISTTMIKIATAVTTGSSKLEMFAKVAGTTGADFAARWRADPAAALTDFISGLDKMQKRGEDVFTVLKDMGLDTIQVRDALLRASGAAGMFSHSIDVGSTAWAQNVALTQEANKRYETTASKLAVAGNQVKDAMIDVGSAVVPMVAGITHGIADIVGRFQALPAPIKDVITWVGMAAGTITLVGGAALIAVPKLLAFRESMSTMASTGGLVTGALGRFGLALAGPWGAAIGIGITALTAFGLSQTEAKDSTAGFTYELDKQSRALSHDSLENLAKYLYDAKAGLKEFGDAAPRVKDIVKTLGLSFDDLIGYITKTGREQDALRDKLENSGVSTGGRTLLHFLDEERQKYLDQTKAQQDAAASADKFSKTQKDIATASGKTTTELEKEDKALTDLIDQFDKLGGAFLGTREAQRNLVKTTQDTIDVLKKNGVGLDINTAKGMENQEQLDKQAQAYRDMATAAEKEAAGTGGATAGLAALSASLQSSRPKLIEMAESFGMSKKEAEEYANTVLNMPEPDPTLMSTPNAEDTIAELNRVRDAVHGIPPSKEVDVGVLSESAIQKLTELGYKVHTLPNGHVIVDGNTKPAEDALNNFIARNQNRILGITLALNTYYASPAGGKYFEYAHGGFHHFASGGMEVHSPQIARARPGAVRVWAEPDTGDESYIPWAMDRRKEAEGVLATTADGFGYMLAPKAGPTHIYGPGGRGNSYVTNANSIHINPGVVTSKYELQTLIVRTVDELKRGGRWNG
jgi:TP901 family phage tail tape measure protein